MDETTFLLVEDDPNDVLMLEMELKKAPLNTRLLSVNDGGEAIQYLEGKGVAATAPLIPCLMSFCSI